MNKFVKNFVLPILLTIPFAVSSIFAQNSSCNPTEIYSSTNSIYMREMNGSLYFVTGNSIFKSDGTTAGTAPLDIDIVQVLDVHNSLYELGELNNEMYFVLQTAPGQGDRQLYKTDGTTQGTFLVADFPAYSAINYLTPANGFVFFVAVKDYVPSVWRTDGTATGTIKLTDLPIYGSVGLFKYNDEVYFPGYDDVNGRELWKSDGSIAGTQMVKDIDLGLEDGFPSSMTAPTKMTILNGELYFWSMYFPGTFSGGLWKTDGTEAGTVPIKEMGIIQNMKTIDNLIYISGSDANASGGSTYGQELWRSDGTEAGTFMVKDIAVGSGSSMYSNNCFTKLGDKVVFAASDGIIGTELWITDGTQNGTSLLKEIKPGSSSSNPTLWNSVIYDGKLYFSASETGPASQAIYTIWTTDGTAAGTEKFYDENGTKFTVFNNELFWLGQSALMSCETTLGLSNPKTESFQIYPNPANQHISISAISLGSELKIYDVAGKTLFIRDNTSESQYDLDCSRFEKGTYLVQVSEQNGNISIQKLIINN